MPRQPNYYRILDIALQADQIQVQHAYRTLASALPQHRWTWAVLLSVGLGAVLVFLGRTAR